MKSRIVVQKKDGTEQFSLVLSRRETVAGPAPADVRRAAIFARVRARAALGSGARGKGEYTS